MGFSKKISAAWGAFKGVVAKSAFSAAFLRGADIDSPIFGGGELLQPYAQSTWVNRAIKLKVDEILRVPLKFYEGDTEYTDKAFADWWKTPFLTAAKHKLSLLDVRKQLASWPDLGGEFFIILGDDWLPNIARRGWNTLSRPIIARPDRMRHVVQDGEIIGWVFTDAAAHQHTLLPDQVIHSPEWNPYDDFRGLATIKVVFNAAESDYLAGLYVRNLMRNNGDQGVFVIAKGGLPDDTQREQIVAALKEKRAKALRGDFAPVFLTGDIAVEDPKTQTPDPAFVAGRQANSQEIYSGLGVPPSLAAVKSSYSIGADSDRFTLITGSSMPLSAKVDAALSRVASLMLGREVEAESDWDDHPVLQTVRRERIDTALKLWGTGMSIKDANSYLDLGMKPFKGWDVGYLPFSVAPVGTSDAALPGDDTSAGGNTPSVDPVDDPEFDEDAPDDSDEIKSLRLLALTRSRARQMACKRVAPEDTRTEQEFSAFACAHGVGSKTQKADRPPREIAQWRTLIAQRRSTVKSFQGAFGRVLMKARAQTLKAIEQYHPDAQKALVEHKAAAATFLFNLAEFTVSMKSAMENQQKAGLSTAGKQLFEELKRDDAFSYPPAKVLEYLRDRENRLRDVPQKVYDRLKAAIEEGILKGDTQAQLASRVKGIFNDIADGDAHTISMTETSACYGAGRHEAMRQAGVKYKQWLTSGNANVRQAHEEANGQTVEISEPFFVDDEDLMFPGDSDGSAGNVINCHCISIAVAAKPDV